MKSSAIKQLLRKEMDRKEFLVYMGFFFLTIFGVSSFVKSLKDFSYPKQKTGFGSGPYGA